MALRVCFSVSQGPKCPSGCRIQGLLDKTDHDILSRIEKIRRLLDENRQKYRSTDQSSKQTYDYLRDRLTTTSGKAETPSPSPSISLSHTHTGVKCVTHPDLIKFNGIFVFIITFHNHTIVFQPY